MYALCLTSFDRFHALLVMGTVGVLVAAWLALRLGLGVGGSVVIAALAPAVTVIGYETRGHQRHAIATLPERVQGSQA